MKRGRDFSAENQWLENELKMLVSSEHGVKPIREIELSNRNIPRIVNMVGTVCILPQKEDAQGRKYRLPLEAMSMYFGPCSQYAPLHVPPIIMRTTNSTTDCTALVFGSGKLVLVSVLSEWHMRYMSQLYRLMIERVPCLVISGSDNTVTIGSLRGRTVFEENTSHNIVGHADFGFKVDLAALRAANPEAVSYIPDVFPAAKADVWRTPDQKCICKSNKTMREDEDEDVEKTLGKVMKNTKCPCTIKCLVFKTGKIVLIGARTTHDIHATFYCMLKLAEPFRLNNNSKDNCPDPMLYKALGRLFVPKKKQPRATIQGEPELDETESVALAIAGAREFKTKRKKHVAESTLHQKSLLTPLMRLAESGRLEQVKLILDMDPDQLKLKDQQGHTAQDRLLMILDRTFEQNLVLEFLQKKSQ